MILTQPVNDAALNLVMNFEALRLQAYLDPVGIWTIGYGETAGVRPGQTITVQRALPLLKDRLNQRAVELAGVVNSPLTSNEFGALCAFLYNVGLTTFKRSSVLRNLNNGRHDYAANALLLYDKAHVDNKLVVLAGLVKRRAAERTLFLTPDVPS